MEKSTQQKKVIQDNEKVIAALNELFFDCGTPEDIAKSIDDILFDFLTLFIVSGDCGSDWHSSLIYHIKRVRDFFYSINKPQN